MFSVCVFVFMRECVCVFSVCVLWPHWCYFWFLEQRTLLTLLQLLNGEPRVSLKHNSKVLLTSLIRPPHYKPIDYPINEVLLHPR